MSDADIPPPDDLAEDFGEGPNAEPLRRFAGQFEAARPDLSAAALGRVQQRVQGEIRRLARRQRIRRWLAWTALAAAVLVAVGLAVHATRRPPLPQPEIAVLPPPASQAAVEDQYTLPLTMPAAAPRNGPLLPLHEYRSLIGQIDY